MKRFTALGWMILAAALVPVDAAAYPGGTPDFQTDVTPFCAACHSSVDKEHLEGAAGDRAEREVAANKHLAAILAGQRNYEALSVPDRAKLVELLKAVDENATVVLEFPPLVAPGANFQVKAIVVGGSGPAVGLALVDRAHRWYARSAASVGWRVVGAPSVIGPDGSPQTEWLGRRPDTH